MPDPDWLADLARYPRRPWLKEQSIWALAVYRFGRRVDRRRPGPVRRAQEKFYWLAFRAIETMTGVSLPKSAAIGPGLRIWHFGNIFVNPDAVIGANCTLRQGVTIGNRTEGGPSPILEDDVELGSYAQVLGGVRIGRGAKVGSMSVVIRDVPAGAVAVGVPARIIERGPGPADTPGAEGRRRPAVFLDRDGTVIENVPYLADPGGVRLFPESGPALRRFREAGYALVVVTNQSAIGRGLITLDQLEAVNAEMTRQLAAEGVTLDGIYYCPEAPRGDDRTAIEHGDRKPGPGMLIRAAEELGLDLGESWMVGDMISDILAGINAGCAGTIFVETGHDAEGQRMLLDAGQRVAPDLSTAADLVLEARPR
jgi:serine O-acetyltransferase